MAKQHYTTSPTPHITIEACGGDLVIEGTATAEVTFELEDESSRV